MDFMTQQAEETAFDRMKAREINKLWNRSSIAGQIVRKINWVVGEHATEAIDPIEANGWVY